MKKIITLLLLTFCLPTGFIFASGGGHAISSSNGITSPAQVDSIVKKQIKAIDDSLNKKIKTLNDSLGKYKASEDKAVAHFKKHVKCWPGGTLIILPVLLLLLAMIFLFFLLRGKFRLSDCFKENEPVTVTNPAFLQPNALPNTPQQITIQPNSSSRILAFISGITAVVAAICALSYAFYVNLLTGSFPDFSKLFDAIMGLGIGIVPYGFNRLANGIKPQQP